MNKIIARLILIAIILVIISTVILLIIHSSKIIKYKAETYSKPGKCPICQTKLTKGYLGYFIARKIYYCPNCD